MLIAVRDAGSKMIGDGIRAVFFDAVGTLILPVRPVSQTYAEVAGRHGSMVTEADVRLAFHQAFAKQEERDRVEGWRTDEDRERRRWRVIVDELFPGLNAGPCFDELWSYFATPSAWRVQDGAGEVLDELTNRGLVVGIASNFDARLWTVIEGHEGLRPVRDRCVVSSLVGWRKPAAEFFAAVVDSAGCRPGQIAFVGDDTRNDIEGAAAAGLWPILFGTNGVQNLRDLIA